MIHCIRRFTLVQSVQLISIVFVIRYCSWQSCQVKRSYRKMEKPNGPCGRNKQMLTTREWYRPPCDSMIYNILVNNTYMWKFSCVLIRIGPDTQRCAGVGSSKYIFIRDRCSEILCAKKHPSPTLLHTHVYTRTCTHTHTRTLLHSSNIWRLTH